nr:MAG TPA: hypothetical protein [Caudoviricetes sp.]
MAKPYRLPRNWCTLRSGLRMVSFLPVGRGARWGLIKLGVRLSNSFGVGRPVRSKLASLIPSSMSSSLMTLADTHWSPARSGPRAAHPRSCGR